MNFQPSFFIMVYKKKIKINSVQNNADPNQEISNVETTTEFTCITKMMI